MTAGSGQATLQIYLGYAETGIWDLGTFQITDATYAGPPSTVTISGDSAPLSSSLKSPMIQSYDGQTLGDIVGSLAATAGMTAAVDPELGGIVVPYLNQHASSGHALQDLERRFDGVANFNSGVLSFVKRGSGKTVSGTSIGGFTLNLDDFGSYSVRESDRFAYSKTRASYFDKVSNQLKWIEAPSATGTGGVPNVLKRAYASQEGAQAAASAQQAAHDRTEKEGTLTLAKGAPAIRAAMQFSIAGVRESVDGDYTISCVTHTLTKGDGLATAIECYATAFSADDETPQTTPSTSGGTGSA